MIVFFALGLVATNINVPSFEVAHHNHVTEIIKTNGEEIDCDELYKQLVFIEADLANVLENKDLTAAMEKQLKKIEEDIKENDCINSEENVVSP